ncbi:MAG TPA: YicC/YloC family endoribonuclease [Terriglobia bacterium]|nr:YicC/YloC family endoribonuclease [Terriglobia bacterium]
MIRSMTGYSALQAQNGRFSVSVIIKTINHRYFDLQMRLPSVLEFFELDARRLLKERILRGHVEVTMSIERHEGMNLNVDRSLLEAYLRTCEALREEFSLTSEPDLVALLRLPGIVGGERAFSEQEQAAVRESLKKLLVDAIGLLNQMREQEGEALARDSAARLERLVNLIATVKKLSGQIAPAYRSRLERRIREMAQGEAIDPSRVAQEITLMSLRSEITEEITRFESHVRQAQALFNEGKETGKKLDFLLQEMNREANTMLSKTTDVPGIGEEIGNSAIEMKMEIEKLREQAQNIE